MAIVNPQLVHEVLWGLHEAVTEINAIRPRLLVCCAAVVSLAAGKTPGQAVAAAFALQAELEKRFAEETRKEAV